MQISMLNEEWAARATGTERFKVYIISSFHGPISFVECVSPVDGGSPSYAVRVVREFMRSEFLKIKSPVTFEVLGPSPFHADISLKRELELSETGAFTYVEHVKKGYNEISFSYDPEEFSDDGSALDHLISELSGEVGLFYAVVRERVKQMRGWSAIQEDIELLKGIQESANVSWNPRKKYSVHKLRMSIIDKLYEFKAESEIRQKQVQEWAEVGYGKQLETYLENHVNGRVSTFPTYPIEALCDWLKHNESRSMKQFEMGTVFVSALIGGLVGALITALVSAQKAL